MKISKFKSMGDDGICEILARFQCDFQLIFIPKNIKNTVPKAEIFFLIANFVWKQTYLRLGWVKNQQWKHSSLFFYTKWASKKSCECHPSKLWKKVEKIWHWFLGFEQDTNHLEKLSIVDWHKIDVWQDSNWCKIVLAKNNFFLV